MSHRSPKSPPVILGSSFTLYASPTYYGVTTSCLPSFT
ncbi:hypothetical protein 20Sep420_00040 [Pseudomonas phage 20Sep420]|nr:hypothetical protein 20Sep420_00040 [Pseudomonas phage 20Sep420]